jgi:tetratricopeptide (TPR) repeat protein
LIARGIAVASLAGFLLASLPAGAQTTGPVENKPDAPAKPDPGKPEAGKPDGQAKHPRPNSADRTRNIEFLFGALKAAPDADSAKLVENRILALWLASGSDTADLLMTRVKTAIDANDHDLALRLLDAVVEIKPDYAEAWNRRATLYFMKKDFDRAIVDLRQVLGREPRHFGALAGLGMMLHEVGDDKRALDIFRRALEVHPHLPRIPDLVKQLIEKVEGRDI